jgi:hypothetical protein
MSALNLSESRCEYIKLSVMYSKKLSTLNLSLMAIKCTSLAGGCIYIEHNNSQHIDTQNNDTQHNDTQHNDTQPNYIKNDTQHERHLTYNYLPLCKVLLCSM